MLEPSQQSSGSLNISPISIVAPVLVDPNNSIPRPVSKEHYERLIQRGKEMKEQSEKATAAGVPKALPVPPGFIIQKKPGTATTFPRTGLKLRDPNKFLNASVASPWLEKSEQKKLMLRFIGLEFPQKEWNGRNNNSNVVSHDSTTGNVERGTTDKFTRKFWTKKFNADILRTHLLRTKLDLPEKIENVNLFAEHLRAVRELRCQTTNDEFDEDWSQQEVLLISGVTMTAWSQRFKTLKDLPRCFSVDQYRAVVGKTNCEIMMSDNEMDPFNGAVRHLDEKNIADMSAKEKEEMRVNTFFHIYLFVCLFEVSFIDIFLLCLGW